ncbi:hypothetical protein ZWY2020_058504 [Hordeum vulgare]|nr:hypothetical protein ZWY2020_058504 [Hordeum vulgare]
MVPIHLDRRRRTRLLRVPSAATVAAATSPSPHRPETPPAAIAALGKSGGRRGICMMSTSWRDKQDHHLINFIGAFLAANSYRLNFLSISPDFIFNNGGLSVAFIFETNWDCGNGADVFSRCDTLPCHGECAEEAVQKSLVFVAVPTVEQIKLFNQSYFKYGMELGCPTFVPVNDSEMGFEMMLKIAHARGASDKSTLVFRSICKQQDISSTMRNEWEQAVQSMHAYIRVLTSIPGIDDHDANMDVELRYRYIFNHFPTLADEDVIGKTDHEILSGEVIDEMNKVKRETYPNPLEDNTAYSVVKQYFVNPDDTVCHKVYFEPNEVHACIVTCGGLCPGLNTVIRESVCGLSDMYGVTKILGIQGGYRGFFHNTIELTPKSVNDIHKRGGTILGSSRGGHDTMKIVDSIQYRGINQRYPSKFTGLDKASAVFESAVRTILTVLKSSAFSRDCLVASGVSAAIQEVRKRGLKVAVAGIPKTIDNDISVILCSCRMPLRDDDTLKGDGGVHVLPVSLLRGRRGVVVQNGVGGRAAEGQRRPEAVTAEEECFHQKPRPQPSFDGWRSTTWSMPIPILSWEDCSPGCTIDADETIVQPMHHKLLPRTSGSISDNEPTHVTSLPVLATGFLAMSMDDDVVCVLRASLAPLARWKW